MGRISGVLHLANRMIYAVDNLVSLGRDVYEEYGALRLVSRGPSYLYSYHVVPQFSAWYYRLFVDGTFEFEGEEFEYFYHPYNQTWSNGRHVEVPLGKGFIDVYPDDEILEIGNVLNHYHPISHTVLDKYERYPGVINEDIIDFSPGQSYDLILAISTIEHIGYDEEPREPRKVVRAVERVVDLLSSDGTFVATWPLAKNPYLDEWHRDGTIPFTHRYYMARVGDYSWQQATWDQVRDATYEEPDPRVDAVSIAVIDKGSSEWDS